MLNMTNYDPILAASHQGIEKTHINGISASDNPSRLLDVLENLQLIKPEMAKPVRTILAHGGEVKEFVELSVYALDQALKRTDASIEGRLAFKASLARQGWLVVPR